MNSAIIRKQAPEEREIERKQAELTLLENGLAERELELATLQSEIRSFENHYLFTVGSLYAELDAIEAQIAQVKASLNPDDEEAQKKAFEARAYAEESANEASQCRAETEKPDFQPSSNLKKLYREVAKRVHPDLANSDTERILRHETMAEVNRAYENGDEARLQTILEEWLQKGIEIENESVGEKLVRLIRKIAQITERIESIIAEISRLRSTDLCILYTKSIKAKSEGRDLLAEMSVQIRTQILAKRKVLAQLKERQNNEG